MSKRNSKVLTPLPKRVAQTPENTPDQLHNPVEYMAPPPIQDDISGLLGEASLKETQMTAADVWDKMSQSRGIKLNDEEKKLLVDEFNNSVRIDMELPDASPKPLSREAKEKMIKKSTAAADETLSKVAARLQDIAAQKLSKGEYKGGIT